MDYLLKPVTPIIIQEYSWPGHAATLARSGHQWLISIAYRDMVHGDRISEIFRLDEKAIERDALELDMTPERVAQYEAEGILRGWGWTP